VGKGKGMERIGGKGKGGEKMDGKGRGLCDLGEGYFLSLRGMDAPAH